MQVNARQREPAPLSRAARYRLIAITSPDEGPRMQVIDCERGTRMFDWSGPVAQHLINAGELRELKGARYGIFPCDKHRVSHLALMAAAARMVLDQSSTIA